jgi:hypothetical protein
MNAGVFESRGEKVPHGAPLVSLNDDSPAEQDDVFCRVRRQSLAMAYKKGFA